jgi:hypothetical protein
MAIDVKAVLGRHESALNADVHNAPCVCRQLLSQDAKAAMTGMTAEQQSFFAEGASLLVTSGCCGTPGCCLPTDHPYDHPQVSPI